MLRQSTPQCRKMYLVIVPECQGKLVGVGRLKQLEDDL